MLVTGGLIAAIAAGWQQVRAFMSRISRFLVIKAEINSAELANAAVACLKEEWTLLGDGMHTYTAYDMLLRGKSVFSLVPFKVLNANSIFYRWEGRRLLFFICKSKYNTVSIHTIRGFGDFNALVERAAEWWQTRRESQLLMHRDRVDRFHVWQVIGREKGAYDMESIMSPKRKESSSAEAATTQDSVGEVYVGSAPNLEYDNPLLYDRALLKRDPQGSAFDKLHYPPEVTPLVEGCKLWLDSSKWYEQRGIPWRRGVLLHGPGGTGKSSLALAVAKQLRIPIYQFFLSTLSNQEFLREWKNMSVPCVALLDDFDTVFEGREPKTEHKTLTFDTVLNVLSGVSSVNGVLLFITTNKIESIDPALGVAKTGDGNVSTRPGRIDITMELGAAGKEQRLAMAKSCLVDWPHLIDPVVEETEGYTIAQVTEKCVQKAFEMMATSGGPQVSDEQLLEWELERHEQWLSRPQPDIDGCDLIEAPE